MEAGQQQWKGGGKGEGWLLLGDPFSPLTALSPLRVSFQASRLHR